MPGCAVAVVDDLLFNRVILSRMLQQLGFTDVLCFESGSQLLRCRQDLAFVLLDIVMPYQDGYATARAFRAQERQQGRAARVPIIACTAELDARDGWDNEVAAQCRLAGMDDCVGKPLSLGVLAALLAEHTGACGSLREGPERFRVSCASGRIMQDWAQRQLSEASHSRCAAEDALPMQRRSLDGEGPQLGRGGGLWDIEALSM
ncbi:hypothetical protein WJX81_002417 [Elliptochloris bilobata]|uniref:histidine kinase n=1 Tax=Elliptochloris bilobata TaxID=381761 RepID=A0AAW1RTN5_9CHLO